MARKRMHNSLDVWAPSADEIKVAEYLAAGYSQNRTSQLTDIPQSTISDWWQRAEFQEYVVDRTVAFLESQQALLDSSIALAQAVYHQGLTGELSDGKSSTVDLAARLLERTVWPAKARDGAKGEPTHRQFGSLPEQGTA